MKSKILLFVLFSILFGNVASAQIKSVTQSEYDEILKIKEKLENVSRIVTTLTAEYSGKDLLKIEKLVQEYESAERNKWTLYEMTGAITKKTLEIIYFDKREFRRENEGEWTEIKHNTSSGFGSGMGISGREIANVKQYAIGTTNIENKPARIFSFYRVYDFGKYLNFYDKVIFVNSDGLVIREKSTESNMFPENAVKKEEVTYVYNPTNLKITMPTTK